MAKKYTAEFRVGQGGLKEVSFDVTLGAGEDQLVLVDASAGPVTVTLQRADGWGGKRVCIKKIDSSVNVVNIVPVLGQTICVEPTTQLTAENQALEIVSDNENWLIIGEAEVRDSVLLAELNANQAGVALNSDIVWDLETLKIGTDISLNTGTGEITLQPGTYELNAELRALGFSLASGFSRPEWVDGANNPLNKSAAVLIPVTNAALDANQATAHTIVTVSVATVVKVRITAGTGTVEIRAIASRAIVKKLR